METYATTVVWTLTWFDRDSELFVGELSAPRLTEGAVRAALRLPDQTPLVGEFPLTVETVAAISRLWAHEVDFERYDYFVGAVQECLSAMTQHAVADGEDIVLYANNQEWLVSWHAPELVPPGKRHGSAGMCVTGAGEIVLISGDGVRWDLPAGRPEGEETWAETLRREVLEEACATVGDARLLGFSRGRCIRGHEEGLVLVRAIWWAEVVLDAWEPRFEILHRKVVPVSELFAQLTIESGYFPIYRRALMEAGIG